jgi:hypothetical protein
MALPTGTNYGQSVTKFAVAEETKNWGSIADGDEAAEEVTVTGAQLGDFAMASMSVDISDLMLTAAVTAADTVTCVLANNTGGAVDLDSGTLYVMVIPREVI